MPGRLGETQLSSTNQSFKLQGFYQREQLWEVVCSHLRNGFCHWWLDTGWRKRNLTIRNERSLIRIFVRRREGGENIPQTMEAATRATLKSTRCITKCSCCSTDPSLPRYRAAKSVKSGLESLGRKAAWQNPSSPVQWFSDAYLVKERAYLGDQSFLALPSWCLATNWQQKTQKQRLKFSVFFLHILHADCGVEERRQGPWLACRKLRIGNMKVVSGSFLDNVIFYKSKEEPDGLHDR